MAQDTPIACTLTGAELPERSAEMRELGARGLVGLEANGIEATLSFAGENERVEALVEAESRCCEFFDFDLTRAGERTDLRVRAPEGAEWAVRGLVAEIVAGWGVAILE